MTPAVAPPPIDLMIVGAPKCGTTSLKAWLGQHPAVAAHDDREFIFFASEESYARGYEAAFEAHFGDLGRSAAARVAKSVAMMYSREALERLLRHNAGVQVVLVLREPIARAHSEFWYAKRRGREPAARFEDALERNAALGAEDARALDAYLARSRYAEHLAPLLRLFPREQVQVLLLEELKEEALATCRRLFALLPGVEPEFAPRVKERHNEAAAPRSRMLLYLTTQARRQPVLRAALRGLVDAPARKRIRAALMGFNEERFALPALEPATRDRLADYFAPWNERLEQLLGRSLGAWGAVTRT
jgi:hypothetical protein